MVEEAYRENGGKEELDKLLKLLSTRLLSRRQNSWCCRPLTDLSTASTNLFSKELRNR